MSLADLGGERKAGRRTAWTGDMVVTRWSDHLTLLVTRPDVQGGQDCQALTSHIDLVPTLLALAGIILVSGIRTDGGDAMLLGRGGSWSGSLGLGVLLAVGVAGCVSQPHTMTRLSVSVKASILIPSGQAHAVLQDGRLVGAADQGEPYCEFEVRRVSGETPQSISQGEFQVDRIRHSVLLDPTTRQPAFLVGSSCNDTLYQESVWRLRANLPSEVLFLRCLAPYHHCAFGPPLSPGQVQQQVGRYLQVQVAAPLVQPR